MTFAQPYYDSDQSLTATAEGGVSGLADMDGKAVGVDTGSTGDMWVTKNGDEYGIADVRRYEGLSPAMLDLQAGRIDGYVSDIPALLYYVKDKPNLKVVERITTGEKYSIMFNKDAALATEVNDVITELKKKASSPVCMRPGSGLSRKTLPRRLRCLICRPSTKRISHLLLTDGTKRLPVSSVGQL